MNVIDFNEDEEIQIKSEIEKRRKDMDSDISYKKNEILEESEEIEEMPEEEVTSKAILKEIFSVILYVAFCFLLMILITTFVGQRTVVSGRSMEDSLWDGDNLIVDKISYRFHDPERFDVVVFPYLYEEDTYYIKRIIGLPGETVYIDSDGNIYIDGKLLSETYGTEVISNPGLASTEITLGEDEYFVLGDNRNNSTDSRFDSVGNIKGENIVGKAWLRIFPFSEFGLVDNIE